MLLLTTVAWAQTFPDIDTPLQTGAHASQDAAVVIGIEGYYELPEATFATSDAQAFRDFLVYTRGVPPSRVELLNEPKSSRASLIRKAAARLGERVGPGGTAWIYFAGHGAASPETAERLLMGVTTSPVAEVFEEGTVAVSELERLAGKGGGRVLLVLDTCYAGAGVADLKRYAYPDYGVSNTEGRATWTAAGPNELSGPLEDASHGAFTYFVIGALRGWADGVLGSADGQVTAEEAHEYVTRAMRAAQVTDQTPVLDAKDTDKWVLTSGKLEAGPELGSLQPGSAAPKTNTSLDMTPELCTLALTNYYLEARWPIEEGDEQQHWYQPVKDLGKQGCSDPVMTAHATMAEHGRDWVWGLDMTQLDWTHADARVGFAWTERFPLLHDKVRQHLARQLTESRDFTSPQLRGYQLSYLIDNAVLLGHGDQIKRLLDFWEARIQEYALVADEAGVKSCRLVKNQGPDTWGIWDHDFAIYKTTYTGCDGRYQELSMEQMLVHRRVQNGWSLEELKSLIALGRQRLDEALEDRQAPPQP